MLCNQVDQLQENEKLLRDLEMVKKLEAENMAKQKLNFTPRKNDQDAGKP